MATRRAEYLARKHRMTVRYQKWLIMRKEWANNVLGKTTWVGIRSDVVTPGPKQKACLVSSATYNATLEPFFLPSGAPILHTVTDSGPRRPPHVRITFAPYQALVGQGKHPHFPLLGFHRRRKAKLPGHLKTVRRTKRDRQITGCNWIYFLTGYFYNDDVLGRHPNFIDEANGVPPGATLWPVPLGY